MLLPVHEIFYSLEGETSNAGFTSVFIRTAGCNLNCSYCDTPGARAPGQAIQVSEILKQIENLLPAHHITVTGGEPLIHKAVYTLLNSLNEKGILTRLETNGSIKLDKVDKGTQKIVDVKTPSSDECGSFDLQNLNYIKEGDELKFLIGDINDYEFTADFIKKYLKNSPAVLNLSPVYDRFHAVELAELIVKDRLPVRLNLQLHKAIGFR